MTICRTKRHFFSPFSVFWHFSPGGINVPIILPASLTSARPHPRACMGMPGCLPSAGKTKIQRRDYATGSPAKSHLIFTWWCLSTCHCPNPARLFPMSYFLPPMWRVYKETHGCLPQDGGHVCPQARGCRTTAACSPSTGKAVSRCIHLLFSL